MGYQTITVELLSSSIIAKSEEYAISSIVRQLNIDNFTAACNGGSVRKHYVRAKIAVSARYRFVISPKKDAVTPKLSGQST